MSEVIGLVKGGARDSHGNGYVCVWKDDGTHYVGVETRIGMYAAPISEALYDAFVKEYPQ
ncbi:MAG: hypothetical protein P4L92_18765 [Rudaea sp.]|nr:hypothetical protein [Rudaea sp.]